MINFLREYSDTLHTLLGALLALFAGFIAKYFEKIEHDKKLIFEAERLLNEYSSIKNETGDTNERLIKNKYDMSQIKTRLREVGLEIQTRGYRPIALKLSEFALDNKYNQGEELTALLKEIQLKLNKKHLKKYNKKYVQN